LSAYSVYFFFFQAEDGIRDRNVTGVQTCALPISGSWPAASRTSCPETPAVSSATGRRRWRPPRTTSTTNAPLVCAMRSPLCRRRSEEHTSELQSRFDLVCRLLLEKKSISNDGMHV